MEIWLDSSTLHFQLKGWKAGFSLKSEQFGYAARMCGFCDLVTAKSWKPVPIIGSNSEITVSDCHILRESQL
jgi:hypothetical protein